jgi:Bacteriophage tail sheath protein
MVQAFSSPGVYQPADKVIPKSAPQLRTGVPGFVGFINAGSDLVTRLSTPVRLNRKSEFDALFANQPKDPLPPGGYLADAVTGFFLNGGVSCYLVGAARSGNGSENEKALTQALEALSPLTDLDLIAIPDVMMLTLPAGGLDSDAVTRVQRALLSYCQLQGNCFAILDALPEKNGVTHQVVPQRHQLANGFSEPVNGALYFPWIRIDRGRIVPPSGHLAGIFARSDARVGVFKAPANEEVMGAFDLCAGGPGQLSELRITNEVQDQLNPIGINCLRAFPGRGIRVWGARSLNDESEWRYVNVCRLVITLRRWIEMNMTWASFEPNTPQLWVRITLELTVYLTDLWRAGALTGQTAAEGFYIKCDVETNPQSVIEGGQVVTEIGLAPTRPAEFVVVRIVHQIAVEPR